MDATGAAGIILCFAPSSKSSDLESQSAWAPAAERVLIPLFFFPSETAP
jgi:hypothetical protein